MLNWPLSHQTQNVPRTFCFWFCPARLKNYVSRRSERRVTQNVLYLYVWRRSGGHAIQNVLNQYVSRRLGRRAIQNVLYQSITRQSSFTRTRMRLIFLALLGLTGFNTGRGIYKFDSTALPLNFPSNDVNVISTI
jgi:hypothetical protein